MRTPPDRAPALSVQGLVKRYGANTVLKGVDLALEAGTIHALLGENGAGKSTLIKILAGLVKSDEGDIGLAGTAMTPAQTPRERTALGLRFVHQDLGLIDTLSIDDNLALETGYPKTRCGLIDHKASLRRSRARLAALGSQLDPERLVGELSQAEKVIVALARAIDDQARVLVLDEVTASLPAPEAQRLHAVIRKARAAGVAILFVSHRLDEVIALCDHATVLRDGRKIATTPMERADRGQLLRWIAGSEPAHAAPDTQATQPEGDRLALVGIHAQGLSHPASLSIRPGEIVGLTGLMGSGYEVLAECVAVMRPVLAGRLTLDGREIPLEAPGTLRRAGFQAVSGHRADSAFSTLSVRENLFPTRVAASAGHPPAERRLAHAVLTRYGVQPRMASELAMSSLSGGNQQKVLFARALETAPRALLMIDPTAGVDVGSRAYLYELLRAATAKGLAVLLASSDFEEIELLADHAWVMADGRMAARLERPELTQARLVYAALGNTSPTMENART